MKATPLKYHGPGWRCTTEDESEFILWAPRENRPKWAACYSAEEGYRGGFHRADTPQAACEEAFGDCPDEALAAEVTRALIEMAQRWIEKGTT
jgi:hypothetical protein